MTWQKSSYSGSATCVQRFRKSSYSGDSANCVEIGNCHCDGVPIRDSKDPSGPVLVFTDQAWAEFLTAIKQGQFD